MARGDALVLVRERILYPALPSGIENNQLLQCGLVDDLAVLGRTKTRKRFDVWQIFSGGQPVCALQLFEWDAVI